MNELDLTPTQIVEITPYLNNIYYEVKVKNKPDSEKKALMVEHRAFSWFWVFNRGNGAEAYRLAYDRQIEGVGNLSEQMTDAACSYKLLIIAHIQEAIKKIREHVQKALLNGFAFDVVTMYKQGASYDPGDFYKEDGSPKKMHEMTLAQRQCVKRYVPKGDDVVIEGIDRQKPLDKLLSICPDLLEPVKKIPQILATIDDDGNVTGLNSKTDKELKALILELEQEGDIPKAIEDMTKQELEESIIKQQEALAARGVTDG